MRTCPAPSAHIILLCIWAKYVIEGDVKALIEGYLLSLVHDWRLHRLASAHRWRVALMNSTSSECIYCICCIRVGLFIEPLLQRGPQLGGSGGVIGLDIVRAHLSGLRVRYGEGHPRKENPVATAIAPLASLMN
jgi:hypothetical protein